MIKKKFLIFDVDGVLIDSKDNMKLSWLKVQRVHNLSNISFEEYFKHIGRPFYDILKLIGVKNNFKKIKKTYESESSRKAKIIDFYKNAIPTLKSLRKKKYILNILTSKDKIRTKKFLGNNVTLFRHIECDDKTTKGKPDPSRIIKIMKNLKANKSQCVYIGDTNIDYQTAKNSNIDFIFVLWGYGKRYNYKYKCKKFSDILKILKYFED